MKEQYASFWKMPMGYIYHLNNVCFFPSVIFLFPINSLYTTCIGKQIPFYLCYGMVIKASLYLYNIKDSSTIILQVLRISDLHLDKCSHH